MRESYVRGPTRLGRHAFLHDSRCLLVRSSQRSATRPTSGRFRWKRASVPATTSTRTPACCAPARSPARPGSSSPTMHSSGMSSDLPQDAGRRADEDEGNDAWMLTCQADGSGGRGAHGGHRDVDLGGVLPEEPERRPGILDPGLLAAGLPLACPHPAEVEAEHRPARPRGGPGQLGADHVVHRAGLRRRRDDEQRRRLGPPVPEPLEHLASDGDERRSLQVLPPAHHVVTRRTRSLR